jgi:hypothetical protein
VSPQEPSQKNASAWHPRPSAPNTASQAVNRSACGQPIDTLLPGWADTLSDYTVPGLALIRHPSCRGIDDI